MTPAQCRAARALLQWSQDELAREAALNAVTVRNFENGKSAAQRASINMMRNALESAGVALLPEGAQTSAGVALRKLLLSPEVRA